jgi:hypothetical protein
VPRLLTFDGKTALLRLATHLKGWYFKVDTKTLMLVHVLLKPEWGVLALTTRDIELLASATRLESVAILQALYGSFQTMSVGVGGGVGVGDV